MRTLLVLLASVVFVSCGIEPDVSLSSADKDEDTHASTQSQADTAQLAADIGCELAQPADKRLPTSAWQHTSYYRSQQDIAYGCVENSSSEHIDLNSHNGAICVGQGSLFRLSVAAKAGAQPSIGICDKKGTLLKDALMMWQQPEITATVEQGVATLADLFITRKLPEGAQLRVAGTQQGLHTIDIATILPSGANFTADTAILESDPVIYQWHLSYWPKLKINYSVDWYILAEDGDTRRVSSVMQTEVTNSNYQILGNNTNPSLAITAAQPHDDDADGDPLLRELPSCYRLVTKISSPDESNISEHPTATAAAISRQIGQCD